MKRLKRLLSAAEDWIFPQEVGCMVCGRGLPPENGDGLCMTCAALLEEQALEQAEAEREERRPPAEGLVYVRAAYPYDGVARRLILALKFEGMRRAAGLLAAAMAGLEGGGEELIVPVPTTRRRLRERGYNQAALLAQEIAQRRGLPCAQALTREDSRAAQMTLPASGREKNVKGCMRAGECVRGKRILLVDDVYTTGSTAREAARALREAGAESVGALVAARTLAGGGGLLEFLQRSFPLAKRRGQKRAVSDKEPGKL